MRHDFLDYSVDLWARDCEVFGPWLLFSREGLFSESVASYIQLLAPRPFRTGHYGCMPVLCLVAQLCPTLCDPMDCSLPGSSLRGDSPGKNTGVGCHARLQGISPTKELKPGLPQVDFFYYPSRQGSPIILEWVAYPFSRGFSQFRNRAGVTCIAALYCN